MAKNLEVPEFLKIQDETGQTHRTRKKLYEKLDGEFDMPVVSFFTSFNYPVMIEDVDAIMLESALKDIDTSKGFVLFLNSPGGSGLAAERIIKVCRAYSGTGEYTVAVPSKAKSAATMIAFGASRIVMGRTSELGPIDPQITIPGKKYIFSAHNVVTSYDELFKKAVRCKGNLQPYLQQLANYDAREIAELRSAISLSEDIAIKALKTGMMKRQTSSQIKKKISDFTVPMKMKVHGRPIDAEDAKKCGLLVDIKEPSDPLWNEVQRLYMRLEVLTSSHVAKCIETSISSFVVSPPEDTDDDEEE